MKDLSVKNLLANRYVKNLLIAVVLLAVIEFTLYFGFGSVIARYGADYLSQHTKFLDYMRQSFWTSGDFFPQWTMNYGLGQSFVIFLYYGLYNPLLMIMYLLPHMQSQYLLQFILLILIVINTLAMTKLLYLNNVSGRLNTFVAVLSSFSGVLFFHISTHPMFIYYLPIMTCSLVALHYLAASSKKSGYMFAVGLIFFTNFTFAPAISIYQFLYYVSILIERKSLSIKKLVEFFYSYLIGVLMGMFVLIPTVAFMMESSSRDSSSYLLGAPTYKVLQIVNTLSLYTYVSGVTIVILVALIGTLVFRRKLHTYILVVPIIMINVFTFINYFLNSFQYTQVKQYIMIIPIYWLLFAKVASDVSRRAFLGLAIVASLIVMILGNMLITPTDYGLFILSVVLVIIVVNYQQSVIAYPAMIGLAVLMSMTASSFTPIETVDAIPKIQPAEEFTPYRVINGRNQILSLSEFIPTVYTSLENDKYVDIITTEYESTTNGATRISDPDTFANAYYQNMYGISNEAFAVNPIVYGVTNDQVYPLADYKNLDQTNRLYAANQGIFVEGEIDNQYTSNFEVEEIYNSDIEFSMPTEYSTEYTIPTEYQNGIMTITFHAEIDELSKNKQNILINNLNNLAIYRDDYGINDNTTITFIVNTYENPVLNIRFMEPKGEITYSDINVTYQELDNFTDNKFTVTAPEAFEVDLNNFFEFDLNLEQDGYLATTIPYANGYTITVDDQIVPVELINDLYIGAQLPAGQHHIKIEFEIPTFKVSLAITTIAILVATITAVIELKQSRKNKAN